MKAFVVLNRVEKSLLIIINKIIFEESKPLFMTLVGDVNDPT